MPQTGRQDAHQVNARLAQISRDIWAKLKRVLPRIPFAEDLLAAYYCAMDAQTPLHVKATLAGALAYFILPIDGIPDMILGLGYTDDAAVLALAIRSVAGNISEIHREAARAALERIRRTSTEAKTPDAAADATPLN